MRMRRIYGCFGGLPPDPIPSPLPRYLSDSANSSLLQRHTPRAAKHDMLEAMISSAAMHTTALAVTRSVR